MTLRNSSSFRPGLRPFHFYCYVAPPSSSVFLAFVFTSLLLLLPVCSFVLHHGVQRWRRSRSSSSSSLSHSDVFTYHMVAMEMVRLLGCVACGGSVVTHQLAMFVFGSRLFVFCWYGELLFHALSCVERHLAVVHAVTYRGLRSARGVRVRNAMVGAVWLLSAAGTSLMDLAWYFVLDFGVVGATFLCVSFCSLAVLRVLIRPRPGAAAKRVDQSKRRAFFTVTAILSVLSLRLVGNLGWTVAQLGGGAIDCVLETSEYWVDLPSSLVLPLLFMHRKLRPGRRRDNRGA